MRILLLFTVFFTAGILHAQTPSIYGWVQDSATGEVIGEAIIADSGTLQSTYSNPAGYFSMGLSSGKHILVYSATGYRPVVQYTDVYHPVEVHIRLSPISGYENDTFSHRQHTLFDNRSSHTSPAAQQVLEMPAILSNPDPVKLLQFMPGVNGGIEGLSGMYVRGGNADQNLPAMEGLPLYGTGHLFGFLSGYNPEQVRTMEFYRGVAPARYGGRAGAVLDVRLKDGDRNGWNTTYDQNLLTFGLNADGPVNRKGTTTLALGIRRSWLDVFRFGTPQNNLGYNLHDLNGKLVFRPNPRQQISIWAYNGRDKFRQNANLSEVDSLNRTVTLESKISLAWQNTLTGITWSRLFKPGLYGTFSAGMSRYTYALPLKLHNSVTDDTSFREIEIELDQRNNITDFNARADFEQNISGTINLRYGADVTLHRFKPNTQKIFFSRNGSAVLDSTYGQDNINSAIESAIYGEWESDLGSGLKLNAGGRVWLFSVAGKTFIRPEPRIMLSQILQGQKAIKLAFGMSNQGVHQLSSVNGNLPSNVWFPSGGKILPQQNMQVTAGFYQPWKHGLEFSVDAYFKQMQNVIDLNGQDEGNLALRYWEEMVAQGKGTAYGVEGMVMKKTGRLSGMASYSWAYSTRRIADINFGKTYPFRWDRRHKIAMQGVYHFSGNFYLNFGLVLMSGNAVTVPTGRYVAADGTFVYDYTDKNNYRMPWYRRVDVGFSKKIKPYEDRGFDDYWGINLYNVSSFRNPLFITVRFNNDIDKIPTLYGVSYFPIVPSIFYRAVF
ncbi:MAG: TonB-dependent receptor plug domain-containing protein [Bacteroidetes bacterium]|nr:TonB-dependent receptor plug domain-containing protein [Bacteroidota bacterium]